MSIGAIIAIVVIAIVLIALLVMLPRLRARASEKRHERELGRRRKEAAAERRQESEARAERAAEAEQRARIAEQEARRERAEAQLQQERAQAYERGMADHELLGDEGARDDEREASPAAAPAGAADTRETDRGTDQTAGTDESGDGGRPRTSAYQEGRRAEHEPRRADDFQEGRADERGDDGNGGLLGRFRRGKKEPAERG
jgi:FtsZ-interacting cell division protein ZipA